MMRIRDDIPEDVREALLAWVACLTYPPSGPAGRVVHTIEAPKETRPVQQRVPLPQALRAGEADSIEVGYIPSVVNARGCVEVHAWYPAWREKVAQGLVYRLAHDAVIRAGAMMTTEQEEV